jgi:hypothetical protein
MTTEKPKEPTPDKPKPEDKREKPDHVEERKREEKGNRGPDEVPGFGEGA